MPLSLRSIYSWRFAVGRPHAFTIYNQLCTRCDTQLPVYAVEMDFDGAFSQVAPISNLSIAKSQANQFDNFQLTFGKQIVRAY